MREIKFRAWDESTEKMLYNSEGEYPFVSDPGFIRVVNDGVLFADAPDMSHYGGGDWSYTNGDFKIMQYTGLKDKNGKEIYEGDIVKSGGGTLRPSTPFGEPVTGSVSFKLGCFMVDRVLLFNDDFEVIGNIYENEGLKNK